MIPSAQLVHSDNTTSLDSWIHSLFSSSSDAIIACDLNGAICAWNKGAQDIFGIPVKQSIGKDLNHILLRSHSGTLSPLAPIPSSKPLASEQQYPTTPERVRALGDAPLKRLVTRTVHDRTLHHFLESISAIHRPHPTAAAVVNGRAKHRNTKSTSSISNSSSSNINGTINGTINGNINGTRSNSRTRTSSTTSNTNKKGAANGVRVHTTSNGSHHSHTSSASSTLVGYSVILTDLSTLPSLLVSPPSSPQLHPSSSTAISPLAPLPPASLPTSSLALPVPDPPEIAPPPPAWIAVDSTVPSLAPSIPPFPPASYGAATAYMSPAEEDEPKETTFRFTDNTSRPSATRVCSADSGFDERSLSKLMNGTAARNTASETATTTTTTTSTVATSAASEADSLVTDDPRMLSTVPTRDSVPSAPSNVSAEPASMQDEHPYASFLFPNNIPASGTRFTGRSNSICFPVDPQPADTTSGRPSARSTSLGNLQPLPPLNISVINRPRAMSIAAAAVSSTSSGTQLSVSMSSSPDKSRLDIHHNSLAFSSDPHRSNTVLVGDTRQEREWDDPHFYYLAPIAANLLACHGDQFFDIVTEELSVNLGVKYAFISQLVSLEELKEIDPTEYMNLVDQFGGVVPPIDGVMHTISCSTRDSRINPHAFQGYLADCTIRDKVMFLDANLAERHSDVAELLMDHTIESYVGMRLDSAQGEIMGVIGIIHDKRLTLEDGSIVKMVLSQVGARVANELDRLRVEANLIYARDVAESTAKNKTKFLADMSHEIRNPMNAVVGVTDILLDTAGLSDEQTGYVEVIRTSGQHLLTVINDILDISRIDQDVKFLLERRPLSLRKCLKDAVSLAGLTPLHDVSRSISVIEWPPEMDDLGPFNELEETNILPLLWSIDQDVPEHLLGDITRLRQVLINLCTNSLKFTQRGRVSVHVSIHNPISQQHLTVAGPSASPVLSRYSPNGNQDVSLPPSPMLTGSDHRTQMVFEQRYDVKADSHTNVVIKPSPVSSRRRVMDKRLFPAAVSLNTHHDQGSSSSSCTPPSVKVVAPTANTPNEEKDDNTVVLEFAVSDTGVGIPANKITELFTSFSQVDISVSTRFGGTGLGLAISASLVEKMGGNIWVESTEGVGSRFTFTIPFTVCQSPDVESHQSTTAPSSPVIAPVPDESTTTDINITVDPIELPGAINVLPESKHAVKEDTLEKKQVDETEGKLASVSKDVSSSSSSSSPSPSPSPLSGEPSKPAMPTYAKVVESTMKPLTINGVPLRILLAEDNAVNQKIAVSYLKKLGYEDVDIAHNGQEVIDKLESGIVYDVILMDVSMPVMDGIGATKTIVERRKRGLLAAAAAAAESLALLDGKGNVDSSSSSSNSDNDNSNSSPSTQFRDYLNLYVIALTASAMGSDKERCMEAGMDDFMTKPFALLEMKRILNEFINKWNSGALQTRNEACLAAALAYKSRCNSPNCQGNSQLAAKEGGDRSLTPTLGKCPSANSSSVNLMEPGTVTECAGCGSPLNNSNDTNGGDSVSGSTTAVVASPNSILTRVCRMETPRPLRKNLDGIGCSLLGNKRSNSDAVIHGAPGSALLGPLSAAALEANIARRASDAFAHSKREWRLGMGMGQDGVQNGVYDIHPLDASPGGSDEDTELSNGTTAHPTYLRVKRVVSPSSLSKGQGQELMPLRPMASPLSPLSLLTTDTEGLSSVSPPLSSSSPSSPTVAEAHPDESPVEEPKVLPNLSKDPSGNQGLDPSLTRHSGFGAKTDLSCSSDVAPAAVI